MFSMVGLWLLIHATQCVSNVPRPFSPTFVLQPSFQIDVDLDGFRHFCSADEPLLLKAKGQITAGTVTVIQGESASGKTTFVKLLAGEGNRHFCFQGSLAFARMPSDLLYSAFAVGTAQNITYSAELHRVMRRQGMYNHIGYMPQDDQAGVVSQLTVEENLFFALMWQRPELSPVERNNLVENILEELKLQDVRGFKMLHTDQKGQLSGGTLERANMALSLIGQRPVLFTDEHSAGQGEDVTSAKVLRDYASRGRIVVSIVHRASDKSFSYVDNLILLSGRASNKEGQARLHKSVVLYWGDAKKAQNYFAEHGFDRLDDETLSEYFARISVCRGFDLDICEKHQKQILEGFAHPLCEATKNDTGSEQSEPALPDSRDQVISFLVQTFTAFLKSQAIGFGNGIKVLFCLDFTLGLCLWLRSLNTQNAYKVSTGSYLMNLFTLIVMSVFVTGWMSVEMTPFIERDRPQGFSEYAFLLGKGGSMLFSTQVLGQIHVIMMRAAWKMKLFKLPAPEMNQMKYHKHFSLLYLYLFAVSFIIGWFFLDFQAAVLLTIVVHLVWAAFLAGFFPEAADVIADNEMAKLLMHMSPPFFILRSILQDELRNKPDSFFVLGPEAPTPDEKAKQGKQCRQAFHAKYQLTAKTWSTLTHLEDGAKVVLLLLVAYQAIVLDLARRELLS